MTITPLASILLLGATLSQGATSSPSADAAIPEPPPPQAPGSTLAEEREPAPPASEAAADPAPAQPEASAPPPRQSSPADLAAPHLQAAAVAIEGGDLDTGHRELVAALAADPQNLDALWAMALLALNRGEPAVAIDSLEKLLALDPYNDDARVTLAQSQWLLGNASGAMGEIDQILTRHPEFAPAMELKRSIESGEAPSEGDAWRPLVRLSTSVNYDSNASLQNGALLNATELTIASFLLEAQAGVAYDRDQLRMFSAFATFGMQTAIAGPNVPGTSLDAYLPSTFGVAATGRMLLGPVLGTLDVRYSELFTNLFETSLQSSVFPSVSATYPISRHHAVRALLGVDIFVPHAFGAPTNPQPELNAALGGALRYIGQFGMFTLVSDVVGKGNFNTSSADPYGANTGFNEVSGTIYGELNPWDTLDFYSLLFAAGRFFDPDATSTRDEATLGATVGARYQVSLIEFFAAYSFSARLSTDTSRDFNRHQFTGGIRLWYP